MDKRIARLDSLKNGENFERNATERGRLDLAAEARQRAVEIRAEDHDAKTLAEKEALQAVYAYEDLLTRKNGRTTRANRTWQMIKRHGIIEAMERAVKRDVAPQGYEMLEDMGLQEYAFEAVILRHPEVFSEEAIRVSRERLTEWSDQKTV